MFSDPSPQFGDTDNNLLFKIAQMLLVSAPGGGVTSFNTRTGAVTLALADVSAVADARYVLKAGDTMTGALAISPGTIVADAPALNLSQTWNNAAVTFTAIKLGVTRTAGSTNSNLIDLQVDGLSVLNVTAIGQMRLLRQGDLSNSSVSLIFRKKGNASSLTGPILNGSAVGNIQYSGWNGTAFVTPANIICSAEEDFSGTANGSLIKFQITPSGTASTIDALAIRGGSSVIECNIPLGIAGTNLLKFGSSTTLAFFAQTPVVRQTSGENLTNNVTTGGVDGTIADFTSLTVYAADAAAIRNDIYQLARKLKQVNDALRNYGLLT